MNQSPRLLLTILVSIAVLTLLFSGYYHTHSNNPLQLKTGYHLLATSKPLAKVSLIGSNNTLFTTEDFKGNWNLVFFGFTHCPDVCPTELLFIKQLLESDKIRNKPNVYFVGLDHKRDSSDSLQEFVQFFHRDFRSLSGDQASLVEFVKPFGTYYEFVHDQDGKTITLENTADISHLEHYSINHTAWIYLINPDGKIHAGFSTPAKQDDMIDDIVKLMQHFS